MIVGNESFVYKFKNEITCGVQKQIINSSLLGFIIELICNPFLSIEKDIIDFAKPALKIIHISLAHAIHFNDESMLTNFKTLFKNR